MKQLSSPIDLIKKAVYLFIDKKNLLFLGKIYIPVAVFSIISIAETYLPESIRNSDSVWLIMVMATLQILYFLANIFVAVSGVVAVGKVVGGGELSVKKTYAEAWKKYGVFLLLTVSLTLIYVFGFILLIIPGVIFLVWFEFSRFIMVEKNLGIKQSLLKSRELVKGNFWKIFGRLIVIGLSIAATELVLSVIPFGVGSIVVSLCGGLFMLPYYLLYKEVASGS